MELKNMEVPGLHQGWMGLKNVEVPGPHQGWGLEGLGVVMVLQRQSWWWVMERLVEMQ